LRIKTIFAPFALCASLALLAALSAAETRSLKAADADKHFAREGSLVMPVLGLTPIELMNTWGATRSGGRTHQGVDLMAPQGAPVLAAADGEIVRFWNSERGGVSIYQADANGELVYYYAHLSARVNNLKEGDRVRQGQVIGYVGATGNATTPHLHFEIHQTADARRWWNGEAVNPYPYLTAGRAPN
jgi:peptidoglycan LD-endopeptidase LytH